MNMWYWFIFDQHIW